MQSSAEFPDLGKTISADTVRDGSAVSACALYVLEGAAGVQRWLCLFLNSSILGVGMLPEEEMWIQGPSQGQHVNNQHLESQAFPKDRCHFCPTQNKSLCYATLMFGPV